MGWAGPLVSLPLVGRVAQLANEVSLAQLGWGCGRPPGKRKPPPAFPASGFKERCPCRGSEAGPARLDPRAGSPQICEARASPADRGFGLIVPQPGCIPCRIARSVGGRRWGITHIRHLSRPPHAWQPCPLERSASSPPRVCSGLTGEPAHAAVLSTWPGTTPEPPDLPRTNHSS